MQQKKKRRVLPWILAVLLGLGIFVGVILAKYTVTWDKEFGLHLVPVGHTNVLTTDLGSAMPDETEYVVFGYEKDYEDIVENIEGDHVGSTSDDLIYMYFDETTKTTYILCEEEIYFNSDSSNMFLNETNLLGITYENANTTLVKDMSGMFQGCTGLTELDLTCFKTSQVTDTESMFQGCTGLSVVYAKTTFNTEKVTSSENMFTECYNLVGGEGTRVYPADSTETSQSLDKTNARIDGLKGKQGFFTEKVTINAFFRSNILKDSRDAATYTVYGTKGWFTITNGLDSQTYAVDEMEYEVTYFVQSGDTWVEYKTLTGNFAANVYEKDTYQLQPIHMDGVTYNDIKVVAVNLSGLEETLEAEISFVYEKCELAYRYENGIIYATVLTNDEGGIYVADLEDGIAPDNSDPNKLFTNADAGPSRSEIKLKTHTKYEFCFFVTDPELVSRFNANPSLIGSYVEIYRKN